MIRRSAVERELDEEHALHIEMETERLVAQGLPRPEARRRALISFGGIERFQQEVREARWTWSLEQAWGDARLAVRALLRRPLFAASAIGTMALAIGASTVLFSAVEAILIRPLQVANADRLVGIEVVTASGTSERVMSLPEYMDYREQGSGLVDLAAHHLSDVALSQGASAARASLSTDVSSNYFRVLDVTPAAGRFFIDGEAEREDAPYEVVLSYHLWQDRFGSDPSVIGETLGVNGQPLTIVGVAPAGFHGAFFSARPEVFLPLGLLGPLQGRDVMRRTGSEWLQPLGRLAPGVTHDRAADALTSTAARLAASHDYPDQAEPRRILLPRFSPIPGAQREILGRSVLIMLAAALALLLIAVVNVASMLIARAAERRREISLRFALGAGRARLAIQLVVEGFVLGTFAGVTGLGLAALGMQYIRRLRLPGLETFLLELPLNWTVLGFAASAAVAAGLLFGLVPAYHALRRDVGDRIRRGWRSPRGALGRGVLVGTQVAMTLVLLVSTALLVQTLRNALATDHGFEPEDVVMAEIDLRLNGYDGPSARAFYRGLLERLASTPGIESAALGTNYPLGPGWDQTRASAAGVEAPDPSGWPVGWSAVSEGYFRTLGFRLHSGTEPDAAAEPPGIVINDALAARFWGDDPAVGRPFRFSGEDASVAGVAPTGKYRSFSEEPTLYAWFPLSFAPSMALYVFVRATGDWVSGAEALRGAVTDLDTDVPLIGLTTLERAMGRTLFVQQFAARFIGSFALFAMLLSGTGIFGMLSFTVEERRREIGVRMALGAGAGTVVGSIVRRGLTPVLLGLPVGIGLALAVGRTLRGLLYGVPPSDPTSFVSSGLLLLAVAAIAVWTPALRATRVDPMKTLTVE